METIFEPAASVIVPVAHQSSGYPVNRIFCVGRNYLDHVKEMGHNPDREPPMFFTKWAESYVENGSTIEYPVRTENYHYEVELVVAIKKCGANITPQQANDHILGYAVGLDMTRRDIQIAARDAGRPWDVGKNFEQSAPMSAIHLVEQTGHLTSGKIQLQVNGQTKQDSDLSAMIWPVPDIISELSTYYTLRPGDLIMTGTPAGVGPVVSGDYLIANIKGLETLEISIS